MTRDRPCAPLPTLQPRSIRQLDTPPPKKLPRSAARNGTQKPIRLSSSLKPLRDEIDREPVGDEEPHRIGAGLGDDVAPGLRQAEQRAVAAARCRASPRRPRRRRGSRGCRRAPRPRAADDLRGGDRARGTAISHRNPSVPVMQERRPPAAERVVDGQHDQRRERAADRRAAVEQRDRPPALAPREPFGDRLGRAGPVAGFAEAERKRNAAKLRSPSPATSPSPRSSTTSTARLRPLRVPSAIDQPAGDRLADRVGDAERDRAPARSRCSSSWYSVLRYGASTLSVWRSM